MKKSLLILEDDEDFLSELEEIITSIEDIGDKIKIYPAYSYEMAKDIINKYKIQMYLLDIELQQKNVNGIMFAEEIRKQNVRVPIIFETAYSDNDLKAEIHKSTAYIDYVSKPLDKSEIIEAIKKAFAYLNVEGEEYFAIMQSGTLRYIWIKEVLYIEKVKNQKNVVIYIYNDKEGIIYPEEIMNCTLKDILNQTGYNNNALKQCHKGFIVNPTYIEGIQFDKIKMKCSREVEIPLGRQFKKDFVLKRG